MIKLYKAKNLEEFDKIAQDFSKSLNKNDIIFLEGDLGSGKTQFVKNIAKVLGIKKMVTSPTFNIIKEYDEKLCHVDAYRLNNEYIEIDEYLNNDYIVCIEWAEYLLNNIKPNYIIKINYLEQGREIKIIKGE